MDLYSGGLITTIKNLETKIQDLEHFLHSNHGLLLAAKRSLVHCYSQIRKLSTYLYVGLDSVLTKMEIGTYKSRTFNTKSARFLIHFFEYFWSF